MKPWDHGVGGPDAGVSADQLAARHIGQETRLPSLELTTALGAARVAWRTPTQSLPQEGNPRAVFQKLFGQGDTDKERAAILHETGSILDRVKGQAARLQASLGVRDRVVVERLPGLGPRDRAACADGRRSRTPPGWTFRTRRSARRTTSPSISS